MFLCLFEGHYVGIFSHMLFRFKLLYKLKPHQLQETIGDQESDWVRSICCFYF